MRTVAIVGVGLIGGSFALALRKAGFDGRIFGVSSENTLREALKRGVVDEGTTLAQAAGAADLVYLAQPIGRIVDTLRHLSSLARPDTLVTDAGSTKGEIVRAARGCCLFLGGHPLAGKEVRGVEAAEAELFEGRTYVITPRSSEDLKNPRALEFLEWLRKIGASPLVLDAEDHDRIVSFTSHLPQLLSTALAATVAESGADLRVAGPGLAGATRLALSPYDVWRDILATNAEHVSAALTACIQKLEDLRDNLRTRRLQEEFERAGELAARLRQ